MRLKGLETPRLRLEPVSVRNAAVLWHVMQRDDLRRFQDVPRLSADDFSRRVASRPRRFDGVASGRFEWLVRVRDGDRPAGWVSLRVAENAPRIAELGYTLLAEERGQGYASEAVSAIVSWSFEAGLERVDACCVPANAASRRVLDALGFTYVRTQQSGAVVAGKPVDVCVYRLLRADWKGGTAPGSVVTARPRSGS